MKAKEAKARIKINMLLEEAGWRFFDDENGPANIQLEANVKLTKKQIDEYGENFEKVKNGFVDFLLLDEDGRPFIVLEAKSEDIDKIMGLNLGGDDYVTKPFVPMELMARVRSHLRRYGRYLDATAPKESDSIYLCGGLELNVDTKTVSVDGKKVKVTPIEFKILELLMKNAGKVFSADDIYERVWNEEAINSETVMVHVRNLREKIEINPKKPQYLKVVWGVGYKIDKQ